MPQKVLCDGCGETLYEGYEIKSPEEIYETYNGRCPKCGKKLLLIPKRVEILPARDSLRSSQ
ncbi:MAG: hypothetical protein QXJ19_06270 [Candidatus Bathyarchaeia archaeon]|nr:hypothetical protein [Candidatus Bathyarchaeota archaeon]